MLTSDLDTRLLPAHVAMIMDGNGRWAKKRLMNRVRGHNRGAETVREVVTASREIGISYLTLYAFSTENWERPQAEVSALMTLLGKFLDTEIERLQKNNIRLNAIGQIDRLPDKVKKALKQGMKDTMENDGMLLTLALSYGSRNEMVEAVRAACRKAASGELAPEDVSEDVFSGFLYTKHMPDPDLLIRTSGEMRISNFLLWQIAYSEIFFTETLWPDFTKEEYIEILKNYQSRDRRFGKV